MNPLKLVVCAALLVVGVSCSRDPDVVKRKYVENGNRYFEKGKYKEANIMYRNALRKDRKYGEAYYRLGLTELKLKQPWNAYRSFRRAVDTDPKNLDAKVQLGNLALMAFVYSPNRNVSFTNEVKDLAEAILKQDPNNVQGLRLRGYYKLAERKPEEALADFRRGNDLKPLDPDIALPLINTLIGLKQNEEAEKLARALVAKHKTVQDAYNVLYALLMQSKRAAEAEQVLKDKAVNNPKDAGPLLQLATHYYLGQRPADGKAVIDRLISNPTDFPDGRYQAGRLYVRLRDFDTAMRHFEEGAKGNPKNRLRYKKAIAELLIVQRKPAEAQKVLEEIIKENPKDDEAKAVRAGLLLETGDPAQIQSAINDFEAGIKQSPRNPVTRFNYGRALVVKGQLEQARIQFQESIKLQPGYLPPRLALAELQYLRGEYGLSRQTAREILDKVDSKNVPAMLIETASLASAGERARARELLAQIIKDHPALREAHVQLAMLDLSEKRYAEAEAAFLKLHQANPADLRGLMGYVETLAAQNRHDRAMEMLKAELQKDPARLQIRSALGNLAFRSGKVDEAIEQFTALAKAQPKAADVQVRLGACYRAKGDTAAAISAYQKARELQPNNPRPQLELAVLYDTLGRKQEARPIYEQVLKLDPDNAYALNNLAYLIAETGGDLDQALAMAQRARQRAPDHPDIADTLGWIYIKKNLSDSAVQLFRELVGKQPDRSTFRYHLALALYQKGDKAGARQELAAALQKRPAKDEEVKIKELLAKLG